MPLARSISISSPSPICSSIRGEVTTTFRGGGYEVAVGNRRCLVDDQDCAGIQRARGGIGVGEMPREGLGFDPGLGAEVKA